MCAFMRAPTTTILCVIPIPIHFPISTSYTHDKKHWIEIATHFAMSIWIGAVIASAFLSIHFATSSPFLCNKSRRDRHLPMCSDAPCATPSAHKHRIGTLQMPSVTVPFIPPPPTSQQIDCNSILTSRGNVCVWCVCVWLGSCVFQRHMERCRLVVRSHNISLRWAAFRNTLYSKHIYLWGLVRFGAAGVELDPRAAVGVDSEMRSTTH